MRQLDCIVPIRVCITGTLNDEQSAVLQDTIASAVEKRLQFARRTLTERMLTVPPPRYHAPTFQLPPSMSDDERSAMADLIKTAIASGIMGRASNAPGIVLADYKVPAKKAKPKPKQPIAWAVDASLDFKILASDFIELMRQFGVFAGNPSDVEYNKLYVQFLSQVRPATALVISIKQAVGIQTLLDQLIPQITAKVPTYASFLYGYTTNERFRRRLIDAERDGRVLMTLPDLSANRVFVRSTGEPYLPAGSKLLFTLMLFPKVSLEESTFQFPDLQVQLPLRDVAYLVDANFFAKAFQTDWHDYLKEHGSKPVTLHIQRFNIVSSIHNDALRYLLNEQARKLYNEGTAIFGGLTMLNSAGIQGLPAAARAVVQPLVEDPAVLKNPGVPADGIWQMGWLGAYVYVAIAPTESDLNDARYSPEARENARRLIEWLGRDRAFPWSWNFLSFLSNNYQAHSFRARAPRALAFEYLLRELLSRENGKWFNEFFDAVEASHNGDLIYFVMKMANETIFANHARVVDMIRRVNATRRKYLLHAYDLAAKEIWINHDPKKKLKVGDRASKVDPWFTLSRKAQRIKAGRLEALQKAVAEEGKKLFGEILAGKDATTYTEDKFTEKVLTEAAKKINLSDKDLEDFTITRTLRFLDLEERTIDGVQRYYITYEHLEREGDGDAENGWVAVPGSKRTVDDGDFEFLLWAWVYNHEAAIVEAFAIGVSILAVIVIAWEVGAIAALVDLAGGALNVAISIGISELIYLCTAEHYTLKGFLMAALDGYLGAVGFRFGGFVGRSIAGQIGTQTIRRLVVGWIAEKAITGIIGGAATGFLTTFANGLVDVATGQGKFPSFGDFVRNMALGAAMGVVFEFAGGALQPLAKVVGLNAIETLANMAKMIREEGISITRFTASAETALNNIRQWARGFMEDIHANGVSEAFEQRIAAVTEALRDMRQAALFRRVLELNHIEINRVSNSALDKILGATEGHMTDQNLLGLFNKLAKAGRLGRFMEMMNLLDEDAVNWLAKGNKLEAFADAVHLQDLIGLRGSEGMRFLTDVFRGSIGDAEGFLSRMLRHGDTVRTRAVDTLLRPNQKVTPHALETVANRTGALSHDSLGALDRLYGTATREAADDFLTHTLPADFPSVMKFLGSLSHDFVGPSAAPLGADALGGINKLMSLASAHLDEVARILNRTHADAGRLRRFLSTINSLTDDAVTRLSGGPELGHLADSAHLLQLAETRSAAVMWDVVSNGFAGSARDAEAWMTRFAPAARNHAVDLLVAPGRVYTPEGIFQVVSKVGAITPQYAAALNQLYTAAANADAILTTATPNQLSLNATVTVVPGAAGDLATIESGLLSHGNLRDIQIINDAAQLQSAGRIAHIEDWAHSTAPNAATQLPDYVTELAAARNLANTAPPGHVVRVGQDALTAGRSFDITQETAAAGGAVERRMEMFTPGAPIRGAGDLDAGAAHAIAKIPAPVRAGTAPRPAGTYEAGIRLQTWPPPTNVAGTTERVYSNTGDWELRDTASGRVYRTGNLADDFARNLNLPRRIADNQHLDMVTVYGPQGDVLFRVRNRTPGTGNDWVVVP